MLPPGKLGEQSSIGFFQSWHSEGWRWRWECADVTYSSGDKGKEKLEIILSQRLEK
jgi:hypothetical protein